MLVLTRQPQEAIVIDLREHGLGFVTFQMIAVRRGNAVRFGIEARRDIRVIREELLSAEDRAALAAQLKPAA